MLTGAIGLITLLVISVTSLPSVATSMSQKSWLMVQRAGLVAIILSVLHFAVLKWSGWFDARNWYNGIPPGTLVVTVFVVFVFLMRPVARIFGKS
ncbi:MAG: hypothetical protein A3B10_03995 [Candidatus Doudnabacteria bacterium RIFCSPLOWO2_01_FULL_44_21]|uniref:Ferric oxidoreductase domain-containing protein n=1 Tax=Candidatus Doudnabacteria bacterium RIFCSPLOWO2_01_FULL_44_21 TaxID=1817841 RepID=A0A1F5Q635_9BACT|nr:MAG: hypothetical protein A3B95_00765 [Candidatus Doudnabacteria bacterium RIFCSPHIGHO2_02_FULL_43_13b]OGE97280.1 MAG: hypothetical protein A3B10_03995 [Candidatus Doudnabacteria bacterium RIFCSPLOWO2_01_FULL_44_21]